MSWICKCVDIFMDFTYLQHELAYYASNIVHSIYVCKLRDLWEDIVISSHNNTNYQMQYTWLRFVAVLISVYIMWGIIAHLLKCYIGCWHWQWLQRRKVARPACNSAHTISEKGSRRNGSLKDQCENTGNLFGPRSKGGITKDFLWAILWDLC